MSSQIPACLNAGGKRQAGEGGNLIDIAYNNRKYLSIIKLFEKK